MVCQQTVALDFVGIRAVFRCEQSANHDGAHICRLRDGQIVVGQIEWGPESAEGHWHPDVWVRGVASDEQADESTELRDRPRRFINWWD